MHTARFAFDERDASSTLASYPKTRHEFQDAARCPEVPRRFANQLVHISRATCCPTREQIDNLLVARRLSSTRSSLSSVVHVAKSATDLHFHPRFSSFIGRRVPSDRFLSLSLPLSLSLFLSSVFNKSNIFPDNSLFRVDIYIRSLHQSIDQWSFVSRRQRSYNISK